MKKTVRVCANCGKSFKSDVNGKKYCSEKCYKAAKAAKNKARKVAKKSAKAVVTEKIALPKKVAVKKVATKKNCGKKNTKFDTIVSVKNGNPFKVFVLATLVRERALKEILDSRKIFLQG